jgi:hypothetical protein
MSVRDTTAERCTQTPYPDVDMLGWPRTEANRSSDVDDDPSCDVLGNRARSHGSGEWCGPDGDRFSGSDLLF